MSVERLAGDRELACIGRLCCWLRPYMLFPVAMMMIRINIASVFFLSR
jgi:hypothetical protein